MGSNIKTKSGYVSIIGKPNSGKSTLLNAILGQKLSIINKKPQTTRKNILGIHSGENFQIIFIDTPGVINPNYLLQKKMMEFVKEAVKDADIIIFLFDAEKVKSFEFILQQDEILELLKKTNSKKFFVLNKIDLSNQETLEKILNHAEESGLFDKTFAISALLNANIITLVNSIIEELPYHPKYFPDDEITTENERFFVSEIIREKILELYEEEIPYSCEVQIDEFKERQNAKDFISAIVYVEKESQRKILIGNNGAAIKKLGLKARKEIENFLDREVFLQLHVKVKDKWRNDDRFLKSFGYNTSGEND